MSLPPTASKEFPAVVPHKDQPCRDGCGIFGVIENPWGFQADFKGYNINYLMTINSKLVKWDIEWDMNGMINMINADY